MPVRIALDDRDPLLGGLRPGLSVEATAHTRDAVAPAGPGEGGSRPALVSEALPR